jgi:hypothetical protein
LELLADTGNPFTVILDPAQMQDLKLGDATDVHTNFGMPEVGWLQLDTQELGLTQVVVGYASEAVRDAASASHSDFQGYIGLPLLRLAEYGGNDSTFWIRRKSSDSVATDGSTR